MGGSVFKRRPISRSVCRWDQDWALENDQGRRRNVGDEVSRRPDGPQLAGARHWRSRRKPIPCEIISLTHHIPGFPTPLQLTFLQAEGHHGLPNSCSPPSQQQSSSKSHQIASDSPDSASERNRENISRVMSWMDKVQTLPLAFSCQFAIHPSARSLPTPPFISHSSTHLFFLSGNRPSGSRPDGCARVCRFSESSLGKITGTIARPVILDDCCLSPSAHPMSFLPIPVYSSVIHSYLHHSTI